MSNILRICPKCQINPATIQCIDCNEKMCYSCEQKVHQKLKQHRTDIIPYSQMKQIKSTQSIIGGISDHSNASQELKQELCELESIIETKKQFLAKQEEKWSTQIGSLEIQYEKKLKDFEKEIENNEDSLKNYYSSGNTTFQIADIKKQMETQMQQAWKELNDKKAKLVEKETLLKDMIQTEEFCSKEIAQKEKLMNQYKELLQQQQVERDLISEENQKIVKQLESIKNLCKKSLPEFGINVDFLDKLSRMQKLKNTQQVDEQDEEYEEDNDNQEEIEDQEEGADQNQQLENEQQQEQK
ncbi:unnamed protein product (macronuclear) [Paramecium tetraurelia]|uniref:B box-type domain-containing protein n=1 Tax=Paramecium tetraurelia TaxID=5888 RepID=A0C7G9_PARTE|nr:uncharacterized protein GSPATT00035866001 [Paramecium tetraurelia]CAK66736.1 unnamed protein product [Paramecium tetraurelia]|eukprot:XP_001434133.1 hypothetical protein (macronuclear) [Paramecium tetraurelia strain d4-2]